MTLIYRPCLWEAQTLRSLSEAKVRESDWLHICGKWTERREAAFISIDKSMSKSSVPLSSSGVRTVPGFF